MWNFDFSKEREELKQELEMLKERNEEVKRVYWLRNEKIFSFQIVFWFITVIICFIFWIWLVEFFFWIKEWFYQVLISLFITLASLWIMLEKFLWRQNEYLQLDDSKFAKVTIFCSWFYELILWLFYMTVWAFFWIERKEKNNDRQLKRAAKLKLEAEWNELRHYWETNLSKEAYIKARLEWHL